MKNKQHGFTILELIIATTVFSVMLLLTTTGMIQIGRVYYKGIINSKTQETARSVSDEISRAVQFGGTATVQHNPGFPASVSMGGMDTFAVCMNNIRYSYVINRRLAQQASPTTSRHVLWMDVIRDPSSCQPLDLGAAGDPVDANTDTSPDANAQRRELLTSNMRLTQFDVANVSSLVNIRIRVIYGEDDLITPTGSCVASDSGGQFCAFSALDTVAKRRL